jgi:Cu(I)-responsive transcriptional regulator
MNIGEASAVSGVTAKMIRYYESIGLLQAVKRTDKGYRSYSDKDVHVLRFIRRCRELGFAMSEITELLALWQDSGRKSAEVKKLAEAHVHDLQTKVFALQQMVQTLSHLVHCCQGDERPECPILEGLSGAFPGESSIPNESSDGERSRAGAKQMTHVVNERKVTYEVRGMTCSGCQRAVVNALNRAGIETSVEDVSVEQGTVRVAEGTSDDAFRRAVEDAGYDVGPRHE